MQRERSGRSSFGKLYVVATPIGNLEDLSQRALRILAEVSIIACEDTRHTKKLLKRYEIKNKLISYFQPKEKTKAQRIIEIIREGKDVALVSDAGTPGISDPGFPLIREAMIQGIKIIPIPGATALTAALSASGLPSHRFLFLGFPPAKKEATKKLLYSLKSETATLIFYLPPRKLAIFLKFVHEILGDRQVVIAREMTKIYEEFLKGTPSELIERFKEKTPKGEATLLIKGC
ncbi:16S rRNA (cytidine(1402)-2'-O)-methyltransferase [Acidobacteriota bacterium]